MSWLVRNMRGIHQRDAVTHLKDIIRQTDLQMLVILEPKAAHREISRFAFSIGFPYWLHGEEVNSHIGVFWRNGIQVEPMFISMQSITVRLVSSSSRQICVTCVYASCLKKSETHSLGAPRCSCNECSA